MPNTRQMDEGQKFKIQVLRTRNSSSISGLPPIMHQRFLVLTCKYHYYKDLCRLPDIHKEKLKHISEVQGIAFNTPSSIQLLRSLKEAYPLLQTPQELVMMVISNS